MTVLYLVLGIVVIIAVIVGVVVPVRRVDAVVSGFFWRRTLLIGTRVWVKRTSKRKPTGDVRNVEVRNAADPERRRYTYEERVWRKMRKVEESRPTQDGVRWPLHILGKDEEIRKRKELYKVTFSSTEGRRHAKKMRRVSEWQSLRKGLKYQLGRNAFGAVVAIRPAKTEPAKTEPAKTEPAEQDP
ncbi:MAG TPA: hypothetical protein VFI65_14390 [Streptosporangiaceae bacterium]|nr:hypothetical protein [Streptosporangiaceae bacterium]